jgi:nitrite transporter NirC
VPISASEALDLQAAAAAEKFEQARRPHRYLLSSMLAGAHIGVAVVLLIMASAPLAAASSPFAKLVQGLVFGVALTLVVFAGSELSTGNMMTMAHGIARRRTGIPAAALVIALSFVGNLLGSALFGWLVHESGVLGSGAAPGKAAPGSALLSTIIRAKIGESDAQLFFRGVLCNFLVCLAVWMAARTTADGAKLAVLFWGLLAFICSGFEHVVANMTGFSLALLEHTPGATAGAFAHNLLLVGLGNLVGGMLLVGAAYGVLGRPVPDPGAANGRAGRITVGSAPWRTMAWRSSAPARATPSSARRSTNGGSP